MNNAIVSLGIVLALFSVSLTGACIFHYGGEFVTRLRKDRERRMKWRGLLK